MGLIGSAGAKKAAQAQAEMMKKIAGGYKKLGQTQYSWISPYMDAGTQALNAQMQMLANPINNQAALSDYYAGPQYAEQMQQAQYATQAGAEAGGGLGNTATGNALAAQSSQMGNQYLQGLGQARQQQYGNLSGVSKQGLNATNTMGNWAYKDYNSAANLLTGAASAQGQSTMAPYTGAQSALNKGLGLYAFGSGQKAGGANTGMGSNIGKTAMTAAALFI